MTQAAPVAERLRLAKAAIGAGSPEEAVLTAVAGGGFAGYTTSTVELQVVGLQLHDTPVGYSAARRAADQFRFLLFTSRHAAAHDVRVHQLRSQVDLQLAELRHRSRQHQLGGGGLSARRRQ